MRIFLTILIFNLVIMVVEAPNKSKVAYASEQGFRTLGSEHFVINYQEEVGYSYAGKIKKTAEKFYRIITQEFNLVREKLWLRDNRTKVFIAKDKETYVEDFGCSAWSSACVNYRDRIIYTYPNYDYERFIPTFVHELTHIIFREYVGQGKLPLWLDEGVATYMEEKYGANFYQNSFALLRERIERGDYIKIEDLMKVTPQDLKGKPQDYLNLFYIESYSIINFIMDRYGKYKFSNLLYYLKRGYSLQDSLSRVSYEIRDLDKLEDKWKRFYQG